MSRTSTLDTNQQFLYLPSSLQIYNPSRNLCLDDGGKEALITTFTDTEGLSFRPCDSSSANQQFIFTTNDQIYNPNWPNNQVCLNGNGDGYRFFQRELILSTCNSSDSDEIFRIVLICPKGESNR